MRFCRFERNGTKQCGLIEGKPGMERIVRALSGWPHSAEDFGAGEAVDLALGDVRLVAPVQPSKIVCIGRNYVEHAKELNHPVPTEPLIFLKPPSSIIGPGEPVRRPNHMSQRVDHEAELGVVIGRRCYRLNAGDDVRPYILGYTCVNDVTARDLQNKDGQWTRAKSFDTFCPAGPIICDEIDPWKGVRVRSLVNGQVKQDGTTADFLFPLDVLVRFISQVMTLETGDLIATGTPAGVGPLQPGDTVEVEVEGVGKIVNPVVNLP